MANKQQFILSGAHIEPFQRKAAQKTLHNLKIRNKLH